jgi:hypothetical protein
MLWFGSPLPGAMMWSIVQSEPSSSLPQIEQIGSSSFFAAALATFHAWLSCHSATCCLVEQDVCSYLVHAVEDLFYFNGVL